VRIGWTGPGELGDTPHPGKHDKAPATSRDRYLSRTRVPKQVRCLLRRIGSAAEGAIPAAAGYRMEPGRTKTVTADEHKRKAAINDAVRYRTANPRTARAQREQRDRFGGLPSRAIERRAGVPKRIRASVEA
jgi:hypothetical protein